MHGPQAASAARHKGALGKMHILAAQPWIFTEIHVPRVPFGCPCRTVSSPWERWSAWEAV